MRHVKSRANTDLYICNLLIFELEYIDLMYNWWIKCKPNNIWLFMEQWATQDRKKNHRDYNYSKEGRRMIDILPLNNTLAVCIVKLHRRLISISGLHLKCLPSFPDRRHIDAKHYQINKLIPCVLFTVLFSQHPAAWFNLDGYNLVASNTTPLCWSTPSPWLLKIFEIHL